MSSWAIGTDPLLLDREAGRRVVRIPDLAASLLLRGCQQSACASATSADETVVRVWICGQESGEDRHSVLDRCQLDPTELTSCRSETMFLSPSRAEWRVVTTDHESGSRASEVEDRVGSAAKAKCSAGKVRVVVIEACSFGSATRTSDEQRATR